MQTIKFQFNVRINQDVNLSIATEHIVEDSGAAFAAGQESKVIVDEFFRGYSDDDEDEN